MELSQKNNEEDIFKAHTEQFRGENYLKKKSDEVIYMINLYYKKYVINKDNEKKEEENLKKLLDNCVDEEFIEIKLHLLKLLGKNIECFDNYLNNEKIEKRDEKTFHFIQNILKEYKDDRKNREL